LSVDGLVPYPYHFELDPSDQKGIDLRALHGSPPLEAVDRLTCLSP
jgi:hypothetical protein